MTLRCKCGGEVRIQNNPSGRGGMIVEIYECSSCGERGTYRYDTGNDTGKTTGCVVIA